MKQGKVMVLAALDTKGDEAQFICALLKELGQIPLLVDLGVLGEAAVAPDISRDEVLERGGRTRTALLEQSDRGLVVDTLIAGAEALTRERFAAGDLAGIVAIGGSGGTSIGTAAMRQLPLGVPKVMVSTIASGDVQPYVGMKDVCMINSVVDFGGVNAISEPILRSACGAISGMITARALPPLSPKSRKPLIAASMFGVTTPLIEKAQRRLATAGYELVPFHATGIGGRTMEALIAEGVFAGVLDLTTTEWADEVVGGTLSAGPERLGAAAKARLPQIVAPGALDMVNFVGLAGLPAKFQGRTIHRHNENVVLLRTTADECREIGRRIAEKLNLSTGPVTVMFPRHGISALDIAGGVFFDPEADAALLEELERTLEPSVKLNVIDAHINDDAFAEACCQELLDQLHTIHARSPHA
jgi:uncharacterized protein (UPF0261 family)